MSVKRYRTGRRKRRDLCLIAMRDIQYLCESGTGRAARLPRPPIPPGRAMLSDLDCPVNDRASADNLSGKQQTGHSNAGSLGLPARAKRNAHERMSVVEAGGMDQRGDG